MKKTWRVKKKTYPRDEKNMLHDVFYLLVYKKNITHDGKTYPGDIKNITHEEKNKLSHEKNIPDGVNDITGLGYFKLEVWI